MTNYDPDNYNGSFFTQAGIVGSDPSAVLDLLDAACPWDSIPWNEARSDNGPIAAAWPLDSSQQTTTSEVWESLDSPAFDVTGCLFIYHESHLRIKVPEPSEESKTFTYLRVTRSATIWRHLSRRLPSLRATRGATGRDRLSQVLRQER